MSTGDTLEAVVRHSADRQSKLGLSLTPTSPTVKGRHSAGGFIKGRVTRKGDLDFVGDLYGRTVKFDAKSSEIPTSFPLENLKSHQVVRVRKAVEERGALAFFLVEFTNPGPPTYWALTWSVLKPYWDRRLYGGRKSIPRSVFEEQCLQVHRTGKTLDLVAAIQALLPSERTPS